MYSFPVILIAAGLLVTCCINNSLSYPDRHVNMAGVQQSGASDAVPLTPFPQNDERLASVGMDDNPVQSRQRCPLCDSSIYPYCGEKMLHDACCCTDPLNQPLPYQCRVADCRFLHANSCREHRLIANCCCSDDYRAFLKIAAQT